MYGFYDFEVCGFEFASNEEGSSKLKMLGDFIKMIGVVSQYKMLTVSPT